MAASFCPKTGGWRSFVSNSKLFSERSSEDIQAELSAITADNLTLTQKQWHLNNFGQTSGTVGVDIGVYAVWPDYTGKGVKIGVIDSGIDYNHANLKSAYLQGIDFDFMGNDFDPRSETATESHGTLVAGVIAAQGSSGTTGVAFGASIAGFRVNGSASQIYGAFSLQNTMDVTNSSWGFTKAFYDNFDSSTFSPIAENIEKAVEIGRSGLGTIMVFAAGNNRANGDNTNYHNFQNSIHTITVGAVDDKGNFASFSTPGASLLVSAPGVGILTTDVTGALGNNVSDYAYVDGTSFAAPVVSGTVALMLEANSSLGYRDVQEILALSARLVGGGGANPANHGWIINGADNFNGGGMHFSNNYGFGMVDAVSAVRLAESWQETSVRNNTEVAKASSTKNIAITDNSAAGITDSVVVNGNLRIDRVEVDLKINHTFVGDLKVELISPDGTVSTVIDRPGVGSKTRYGISDDNINFTVSSNAFWGEESSGNWRLKVYDLNLRDVGNLVSWNLNVYGDDNVNDDNYVFTNEYSSLVLKDPSRSTISDSGGIDTLNLSANAGNNIINLSAGAINQVGGAAMVIAAGTVIENVFTGDGNDVIIANAENNKIMGGRGNDIISTGKGSDTVILRPEQEGRDVIKDFNVNADKIDLSDYDFTFVADTFSIFMQNHVAQESLGALLNLGGSVAAILENVAASALGFEDFIF